MKQLGLGLNACTFHISFELRTEIGVRVPVASNDILFSVFSKIPGVFEMMFFVALFVD